MERCTVVPDGNVIGFPAVSNLEVVVLRDVELQEVQHTVGFFGRELDDPFCKPFGQPISCVP